MGRHLLARAPVDDQRLVRAHPAGDPGGVHRGVAAAVDRDAAADHRPLAGGDAAQERHGVEDPAGVPRGNVDALGQVGTDRDEDRVEPALLAARRGGRRPGARRSSARRTPRSGRARRRARRAAAGRPGCRSASSRPARRRRRGSPPRGRAGPGGRRPRARSGPAPITSTRLPLRDRWRVELPALLEREVAEEPLDRVDRDGTVEARRGCRRSRTGGSRPVRGSRETDCPRRARATPARGGPPGCATARPGCSRRPGSRRCTAAAGRRTRAALSDRAGVGAPVQQVRQRRHVPQRVVHACRPRRTAMTCRLTRLRMHGLPCPPRAGAPTTSPSRGRVPRRSRRAAAVHRSRGRTGRGALRREGCAGGCS